MEILRIIWIFLWILRSALSCEDSFEISSENSERRDKFLFKNDTTVGKHQRLSWEWRGKNHKEIMHSVLLSPTGDALKGLFLYKAEEEGKKVRLAWIKRDSNISLTSKDNLGSVFLKWKTILRSCQTFEYESDTNGNWWFKLGDLVFTNANVSEREAEFSGQQKVLERIQRSSDESESPAVEETKSQSWYSKVYNFFFGSGSARRNESDGVFVTMWKWMKGLSCELHGPCDRDEPIGDDQPLTPDFVKATPLTLPPLPDATEINEELNSVIEKAPK